MYLVTGKEAGVSDLISTSGFLSREFTSYTTDKNPILEHQGYESTILTQNMNMQWYTKTGNILLRNYASIDLSEAIL